MCVCARARACACDKVQAKAAWETGVDLPDRLRAAPLERRAGVLPPRRAAPSASRTRAATPTHRKRRAASPATPASLRLVPRPAACGWRVGQRRAVTFDCGGYTARAGLVVPAHSHWRQARRTACGRATTGTRATVSCDVRRWRRTRPGTATLVESGPLASVPGATGLFAAGAAGPSRTSDRVGCSLSFVGG